MKKLSLYIFLGLMVCNVGVAEIKSNYNCSGIDDFIGKIEYDLKIKKRTEKIYDVYHSGMVDKNPFFAYFFESDNSLIWFSSSKLENGDRNLFIDRFIYSGSGYTHLLLTVSDIESTAEFDQLHITYENIVKMKKDPTNVDPDALYYLENNWFKKINAIAQKAFKKENYEILSELECD